MNAIVIEHVKVSELPDAWRTRLQAPEDARVKVRIEQEEAPSAPLGPADEDNAFGMWRDRADMADVEGYVRRLRSPRFAED